MDSLLLAFDKFKDALDAESICREVACAVRERCPEVCVDAAPLTDGGEGFASILTRRAGGELRRAGVCGPCFDPVEAEYGTVALERLPAALKDDCGLSGSGEVAVIEMARASGLELVPPERRDPWTTTSRGTGDLLAAAADRGARAILLGVGGSATHDLGLGALSALGLRVKPEHPLRGTKVPRPFAGALGCTPGHWEGIREFATRGMRVLPPIRIACDVENPLLGSNGAVFTFARQKGAKVGDLPRLESATHRMAAKLCRTFGAADSTPDEPGAGAAGGIAFGLQVACGARRVPGFELVSDWLGLSERLKRADVVFTGEGRFDSGSLSGKGPGRIVREATAMGKPVVVLAGAIDLSEKERQGLRKAGVWLEVVTPEGMALEEALPRTAELLEKAVQRALNRLNSPG